MSRPSNAGHGWALGVDLGTEFTTAVLTAPDGRVLSLVPDGGRTLSSAVVVTPAGLLLSGHSADAAVKVRRGRLVPGVKDGLARGDLRAGAVRVDVVEAATTVLRQVRAVAVRRVGGDPAGVALGFPPGWSRQQRSRLARAAERAGWPDAVLVPEPVCAARYLVACGVLAPGRSAAIHDFGAGHLHIGVVRPTAGTFLLDDHVDAGLGGRHLDEVFRRLVADRRPAAEAIDLDTARDARERLSFVESVSVPAGPTGVVVSRPDFERAIAADIRRSAGVAADLVHRSSAGRDDLAGIYLIGGVSRTPLVAAAHRDVGHHPVVPDHAQLAVAAGAALLVRSPSAPAPLLHGLAATDPVPGGRAAIGGPETALPQARGRRRRTVLVAALVAGGLVTAGVATLRPDETPTPAAGTPPSAVAGFSYAAPPPRSAPARTAPGSRSPDAAPVASASRPRTSAPARRPATAVSRTTPPFRVPAEFALVSGSGLCATPDQPRDQDAIAVRLRPCANDPAQRWRRTDLGGGVAVLTNAGTGKCLDLNTAPGTGGGLVQQWLCRDNDHQKWRITAAAGGTATLQVRITGDCLAVAPDRDAAGVIVHRDTCTPASSQVRWRLSG